MALTTVIKRFAFPRGLLRGLRFGRLRVTFDSSYPTGGEVLGRAALGLETLLGLIAMNHITAAAAAYTYRYDNVNDKILVYDLDSEVANATDLSGLTVDFFWIGC